MARPLSPEELALRKKLMDDFPVYASGCLKIRTKTGDVLPLQLNRAQQYLHERLEEQRARTGKVRALVLKGRQQGISTYIGGRFYWKTTHGKGLRCFVLTHEQDATNNLFSMVERFHDHCPAVVKPSTGASNAKELWFNKTESGYAVGTAGTKAVGRSQTIQLMHGSEVAFWPNAATHFAGVVQAVPDLPGTELILESTANGLGGEFHERWQRAEAGIGDYIAVFIPWFWSPEYRRSVPVGFTLDDEGLAYMEAHSLDMEQMAWRHNKIAELKDPLLFKQEYPSCAPESFQTSGHDSFIPAASVLKARKANLEPSGPLVIGYDPNWKGKDRASMAWRRGRKVLKIESRQGLSTMEQVGWLKQVIDAEKPARVFIDVGGGGIGICDRLDEIGYGDVFRAINFGSEPFEPQPRDESGKPRGGYRNRRAEMWGESKEWLDAVGGADIPDSDSLQADACAPSYKYDSLTRVLLESKDDIRKRGMRSPDEWDAVALIFAEPVNPERTFVDPWRAQPASPLGKFGWMV